jgi:tripartite-type tricarboxylate transporter receptor subunit TctC
VPVLPPQVMAAKLRAMAKAGYPKGQAYNRYSLFAPAGTPRDIVARPNAEIVKAMNNPSMKALAQRVGTEAAGSTPEQSGVLHKSQFDKWGRWCGLRG